MRCTTIVTEQALDRFETLHTLCRQGLQRAQRSNMSTLVSYTQAVPRHDALHVLGRVQDETDTCFFWSAEQGQFSLVGGGEAICLDGHGEQRYNTMAEAWDDVLRRAVIKNEYDIRGTGPVGFGGFRFDAEKPMDDMWRYFPDGRLVLPEMTYLTKGDNAWLTYNIVIHPDDDVSGMELSIKSAVDRARTWLSPALRNNATDEATADNNVRLYDRDEHVWRKQVHALTAQMQAGHMEKVVLARAVRAKADEQFCLMSALRFLHAAYPDCFIFRYTYEGHTFLGATPERLVSFAGSNVQTMCLAGSIGRGKTQDEDEKLGNTLLHDAKERREHFVVLESIQNDLDPVCERITHAPEPVLLKLQNVQHLLTPMQARRKPESTVFDVIKRLHPTPAVGGSPRKKAMRAIREYETFDRGWYASPIGWLDARGDGEFAVALRSALVHQKEAVLFAGCGIMPTSQPEKEYEESRLKLRPMLAALGGQVD